MELTGFAESSCCEFAAAPRLKRDDLTVEYGTCPT